MCADTENVRTDELFSINLHQLLLTKEPIDIFELCNNILIKLSNVAIKPKYDVKQILTMQCTIDSVSMRVCHLVFVVTMDLENIHPLMQFY